MLRIGINGFGRMGRLATRLIEDRNDLEAVAVNEPFASAEVLATLLEFDTQQGRFHRSCRAESGQILIDSRAIPVTDHQRPADIPWGDLGVDLVLECSGKFREVSALQDHLGRGATRVVVSAPVSDGIPNIVVGVNHDSFVPSRESIVTAASCTTNCLAPVARVILDEFGIHSGTVTTIHAPTNTQSVTDSAHRDPRRARASQSNLIPTSTNSAVAVGMVIPELAGRLDSIAVRAPVLNASLVDAVFQVEKECSAKTVNEALRQASESDRLAGILGFETRPLVSCDFAGDPRSAIIDAASTRVTRGRLLKIMAWYDNEWGYVNRMVELAAMLSEAQS